MLGCLAAAAATAAAFMGAEEYMVMDALVALTALALCTHHTQHCTALYILKAAS